MREKDILWVMIVIACRITPACAGKRVSIDYILGQTKDHPRMCGKKCFPLTYFYLNTGSPPHVREKATSLFSQTSYFGITPACAGKSRLPHDLDWYVRDHPRMCGKKIALVRSAKGWWGSPPHVREKERDEIKDVGGFGITPACAGKSRLPHDLDWYVRDHPRMCGKKIALVRSAKGWWGSPPHVREKD